MIDNNSNKYNLIYLNISFLIMFIIFGLTVLKSNAITSNLKTLFNLSNTTTDLLQMFFLYCVIISGLGFSFITMYNVANKIN